jgi:hypothetical protein
MHYFVRIYFKVVWKLLAELGLFRLGKGKKNPPDTAMLILGSNNHETQQLSSF